jgi:hypothetical protein
MKRSSSLVYAAGILLALSSLRTVHGWSDSCGCCSLVLRLYCPAYAYIVDPIGRRFGKNPHDGQQYSEIPRVFAMIGDPSNTTHLDFEKPPDPDPMKYTFIQHPYMGRYTINIVGTGSGSYKLEIKAMDARCAEMRIIRSGRTYRGKIDTIVYVYDNNMGDTTPPITKADCVDGQWVSSSVYSLDIRAADYGSGVALLYVGIDGALAKAVNGPTYAVNLRSMTKEGTITLEYWSLDNSGNRESKRTSTVRRDVTPPHTSHDYAYDGSKLGPRRVTFHATDNLSGVSSTWVGVTHGPDNWDLPGGTVTLKKPGTYRLSYSSTDRAGNVEQAQTLVVVVRGRWDWLREWWSYLVRVLHFFFSV